MIWRLLRRPLYRLHAHLVEPMVLAGRRPGQDWRVRGVRWLLDRSECWGCRGC